MDCVIFLLLCITKTNTTLSQPHRYRTEVKHSLMGLPKAQSLVCVVKIAQSPARAVLREPGSRQVTPSTVKNTAALARSMPKMKVQFTEVNSTRTKEVKMTEGSANVPTKVFKPLTSDCEMIPSLPAVYLETRPVVKQ